MSKAMNLRVAQAGIDMLINRYKGHCPTAVRVVDTLQKKFGFENVEYDHLAFRTFGTDHLGIKPLGDVLLDLGFVQGNYFTFTEKKLLATWFAPPKEYYDVLPRIFISQIKLPELSPDAQKIINSYTSQIDMTPATLLTSLVTGERPWRTPDFADYEKLSRESEYAAWVLAHGYSLNHFALSCHRFVPTNNTRLSKVQIGLQHQGDLAIPSPKKIANDVTTVTENLMTVGYPMNKEGTLIKTSPDGLLLQSSTLSDLRNVEFSDGVTRPIPGSYVEFVTRKAGVDFTSVNENDLSEWQRRDGFETLSADKIFESTFVKSKN